MADMEKDLEKLFAAARRDRDRMPDGLSARMQADARAMQDGFRTAAAPVGDNEPGGLWAQVRQALGGWPGIGGLATACAAGVWIGLAPPDYLPDPVDLVYQQAGDVDVFDGAGLTDILTEDG